MTLPAKASIESYGGIKKDYEPVSDGTTDVSAAELMEVFVDTAGMTQTCVTAWCCALGRASSNGAMSFPATGIHAAVWPDSTKIPANMAPAAARIATGTYEYTWPANVTDAKGITRAVNFRRAFCHFESTTTVYFMSAAVTAPNKITVYVRNTSGTLVDAANVPITVFAVS